MCDEDVFSYETESVAGFRVCFIDYYRRGSLNDFEPFSKQLLHFKAGFQSIIDAFSEDLIRVVESEFPEIEPDFVVPVIGSKMHNQNDSTPVGRVSENLARALGCKVSYDLVRQRPDRPSFHKTMMPWDQRWSVMREAVEVMPCRDARVFLVDDVLTSGATIGTYGTKIMERGGIVLGGAVIARTTRDWAIALLNPNRYTSASFIKRMFIDDPNCC